MEQKNSLLFDRIRNDRRLALKFQIISQIGVGCFGTIYKAINLKNRTCVAIKIQVLQKNDQKYKNSSLANQINILQRLKNTQGIPHVYSVGKWDYGVYMEMQLLLSSLNQERNKQYTYPQIKTIAVQLLQILRRIHSKGVVHQDLKPQNIMRNRDGNLVIIDFGLSTIFGNSACNKKKKGFIGTPRYASLAAHKGYGQSPKDDIESMLYVIGTLYLKRAPWFQLKAPVSDRLQMIQKYKKLCNKDWFKTCGNQFVKVYEHLQQLNSDWPNYSTLINLFHHHRETMIIKQKPFNKLQKSRRKSEAVNVLSDSPLIQIHYAEKNNPISGINLNYTLLSGGQEDKIQNSRSNNSFSQVAQDGLQMMLLLTENLLKFNEESGYDEQNQAQNILEQQPNVGSILKYPQLCFKNPFLT